MAIGTNITEKCAEELEKKADLVENNSRKELAGYEEKTSYKKNNMCAADSYTVYRHVIRHFLWSERISDVSGRYFPDAA